MNNQNITYCANCGREIKTVFIPQLNKEISVQCNCATEQLEKEKRELIQKGYDKIKNDLLLQSGVGKKFQRVQFKEITCVAGQEKAYSAANDFISGFSTNAAIKGFGLFGCVGSGKTHLVAAIANHLCNEKLKCYDDATLQKAASGRLSVNSPVKFISTIELLEKLKSDDKQSSGTFMKNIKNAKLLILDDLGAARFTEWADERLFEIVDYRYQNELPIIFTTNITPDELKNKINERTNDRLCEMCDFVSVTAPSQRSSK